MDSSKIFGARKAIKIFFNSVPKMCLMAIAIILAERAYMVAEGHPRVAKGHQFGKYANRLIWWNYHYNYPLAQIWGSL